MSTAEARLAADTQRSKPFANTAQAAVIGLLVTADHVRRQLEQAIAASGELTMQQFNVLRILRGAGADGMPTLSVADRLLEPSPGTTRMMDRLERKGLIVRQRSEHDRRQVRCVISAAGSELLDRLDPIVDRLEQQVASGLAPDDIDRFLDLLERCRHSSTAAT